MKAFDCVEMQSAGALRIFEETSSLTFEEKLRYWREKSEEAVRRQVERVK